VREKSGEPWRSREELELCTLAESLFPGAVRVTETGEAAVARTRELLADPATHTLRDACFAAGPARARADFLVRESSGRFGLRAVRASLRPTEAQLDTLAFASAVARAAGVELGSVGVLHLAPDFVRQHAAPGARELFRHSDVSKDVAYLARDVPERLAQQARAASAEAPPAVEPSPHCRRPDACPHLALCTGDRASDWLGHLPRLRLQHFAALSDAGVRRSQDIADEYPLERAQRNARQSARDGRPFVSPGLASDLAPLAAGADFLDFEAILPGLPLYPGTRPLDAVPFQWSAHLSDGQGGVTHAEFLAEPPGDPRRAFAAELVAAFRERERPVVVYSGFEAEVLARLARDLPEHRSGLDRLRGRLWDLLPVVRRSVYHPDFRGSFSLKRVAPVLAPGFGFSDLPGIADGRSAARAWHAWARGELGAERAAEVRGELLAYCGRDSLALFELLRALRSLAASQSAA
jgi:hypothetical protein